MDCLTIKKHGCKVGYSSYASNFKDKERAIKESLHEYELTKLTPDQIQDLQNEIETLKAKNNQLEYANEEMTYIIQKVAHRRCDYCVLRNDSCDAKGLNAECNFEYISEENREKNSKDIPVNVIYVDDVVYNGATDSAVTYKLPQCPTCKKYPTYNLETCPWCEQKLIYGDDKCE